MNKPDANTPPGRDAPPGNHLTDAAREANSRAQLNASEPEPSLGKRFAQIGVLGWIIVIPVMIGLLSGRLLDRIIGSGIMFSAALTMAGAALGLWLALRWMHEQ